MRNIYPDPVKGHKFYDKYVRVCLIHDIKFIQRHDAPLSKPSQLITFITPKTFILNHNEIFSYNKMSESLARAQL